MTIELTMLVWALVLAFVQILLFDFARTSQYGMKWNTGPRDENMPALNPMAGRLQRARGLVRQQHAKIAADLLHLADRVLA